MTTVSPSAVACPAGLAGGRCHHSQLCTDSARHPRSRTNPCPDGAPTPAPRSSGAWARGASSRVHHRQQGGCAQKDAPSRPRSCGRRPCQRLAVTPHRVTPATPRAPGTGPASSCRSRKPHTSPVWCHPRLQDRTVRCGKSISGVQACRRRGTKL